MRKNNYNSEFIDIGFIEVKSENNIVNFNIEYRNELIKIFPAFHDFVLAVCKNTKLNESGDIVFVNSFGDERILLKNIIYEPLNEYEEEINFQNEFSFYGEF